MKLSLYLARKPHHCWNGWILALAPKQQLPFGWPWPCRQQDRLVSCRDTHLSPVRKVRPLLCRAKLLLVTKLVLCFFLLCYLSTESLSLRDLKLNNPGEDSGCLLQAGPVLGLGNVKPQGLRDPDCRGIPSRAQHQMPETGLINSCLIRGQPLNLLNPYLARCCYHKAAQDSSLFLVLWRAASRAWVCKTTTAARFQT